MGGIVVDTAEARVAVGGIRLIAPAARHRHRQGARKLNLLTDTAHSRQAGGTPRRGTCLARGAGEARGIEALCCRRRRGAGGPGRVQFTDQGLVLPFSAHIHELSGAITRPVLGSQVARRPRGSKAGSTNSASRASAARSTGFSPKTHTDMKVEFRKHQPAAVERVQRDVRRDA